MNHKTLLSRDQEFQRKLASLLHMLFCGAPHEEDMLKLENSHGKCCFYLEHTLVNAWDHDSHLQWLDNAQDFVASVGRGDPERAFKLLSRLVVKRQELEELFHESEELRSWFELLL